MDPMDPMSHLSLEADPHHWLQFSECPLLMSQA